MLTYAALIDSASRNKSIAPDQVAQLLRGNIKLDAEGNVSDLTATDPGYRAQVTSASIQEDVTITFPGVLGDGQTPDEKVGLVLICCEGSLRVLGHR